MKLKEIPLLIFLAMFGGCGTIKSISSSDKEIQEEMVRIKSDCESLPRVYSGVAYDFCFLASHRASGGRPFRFTFTGPYDMPMSAILDTVFLPYTIYSQVANGSVEID